MKKTLSGFLALAMVLSLLMGTFPLLPISAQTDSGALYGDPLVHYDMTLTDGLLADTSGNGYDAALMNLTETNFSVDENGNNILKFENNGYIKIPDCLNSGQNTITIEMTYKIGSRNNEGFLTFGTKNASTSGNNYLRFHPNENGSSFLWESELNNSNNAKMRGTLSYDSNAYTTVTVVIQDGVLQFYSQGKKVGTMHMNGVSLQDILNSSVDRSDAIGFIGRPAWANHDPYFTGILEDFVIYDYAVSEQDIFWMHRDGIGPVVDYSMELTDDGKLRDTTGYGFDGGLVGLNSENLVDDGEKTVLDFFDTKGYVKLPDGVIQGGAFSISTTFQANENENSALWTLGTKVGSWPRENYVRLHPSTSKGILLELVADQNSVVKIGGDGSINIVPDAYNNLTTVFYEDGLVVLYLNGEEIGRLNHSFQLQQLITDGTLDKDDCIGFIGRSIWVDDPAFSGKLSGFTIYERALTADEVYMMSQDTTSSATTTKIVSNTLPCNVPGVTSDREWREGMVSGNGHNGVINAGYPYSDTLIYQNMYLLMPSTSSRENPNFYSELEANRQSVVSLQDNIPKNPRGFFYAFHPGPQLRLNLADSMGKGNDYIGYERFTDFETAEVGVSYVNPQGAWERRTFTSREDDVTITQIKQSSTGAKVNMEISLDNLSQIQRFYGDPTNMQYKKVVDDQADFIALIGKYPGNGEYVKGELKDGGYVGTAQVVVVGGTKEKITNTMTSRDSQNVGEDTDPRIKITDADAVYIIEKTDRTWDMCTFDAFAEKTQFDLLDQLNQDIAQVVDRYTQDGVFSYDQALAPHAKLHGDQFNAVSFSLNAKPEDVSASTESLLQTQKGDKKINDALMERAYYTGRYVELCCSGYSTSRLGGMWTGEWNNGWRGIYTMDANVNIQVSPMNTGNLKDTPIGYINFILRQLDDWMENAYNSHRMHDAIQPSVNTDGDSSIGIESDWQYPFQYWNAGASWLLLPIYEYWQCYGNQQIEITDKIDLYRVKQALGVQDGGLSDEQVDALMQRGWLYLEQDILLPLLTKQANFWEQLMTPEYYMDAEGNPHYEKGKTQLDVQAGEKYMITPSYSPENGPRADGGYTWDHATTMNATMDIAAAKDGLSMTIEMEKAVGRAGSEQAIQKWENLKNLLPEYQYDGEPGSGEAGETWYGGGGALREWATPIYMEENRHRHISHMYVAWPAYETQHDEKLALAAEQALANRNRLNSGGEKTTGHGWMHYALTAARLKDDQQVYDSLYTILSSDIYYSSMVTDHNTNRGSGTYCTDTSIGLVGVVNESLLFSNTGEIQILPSLPEQWSTGSMNGLMARTRAEVEELNWDLNAGTAHVKIRSDIDQKITLTSGIPWKSAIVEGADAAIKAGKEIQLSLKAGDTVTVAFSQSAVSENTDKTILEKVLTYAEEQYASDAFSHVITDVQATFTQALVSAREVYADPGSDQNTVDQAWKTLMTEIHKLGFVQGDKTSLNELIALAETFNARIDQYTPSTASPFTTALTSAKSVVEDGNALQDEVARSESALLGAMLDLRFKADKSILQSLVERAEEIDVSGYDAMSIVVFQNALARANETLLNLNLSEDDQAEVDRVTASLQEAMNHLTEQGKTGGTLGRNVSFGDHNLNQTTGSARTGEATPVAAVVAILLFTGLTAIWSHRKRRS